MSERRTQDTPRASLELLGLFQDGRSSAGNALLQRYEARIRQWAASRIPSQARQLSGTGDVVTQVMWKLYKKLPSFQPTHDAALAAYIRKAVLNEVRTVIRSSARHHRKLEAVQRDEQPCPASPLEDAIGTEALERFEGAFERLPGELQSLIHLRLELGFGFDEIQKALGKPSEDAARMATRRAFDRLAEEMKRDEEGR